MRARMIEFLPGLIAGIAAGFGSDLLLGLLLKNYGIWMPVIAGALVGLACGQASPVASTLRGIVIALYTLALVVVIQWEHWTPPFPTDGSLLDYTKQLHRLPPMTLGAMAVNVAIALYWGREQGIQFARRAALVRGGSSGEKLPRP